MSIALQIGPLAFQVTLPSHAIAREAAALYQDYPKPDFAGFADCRLAVRYTHSWRGWLGQQITVESDAPIPFTPLPAHLAVVAAEMGMNYHIAMGLNRLLLLHASGVARDGAAILFSADSGSGKSTLAAALALDGWRLLSDEFGLVEPGGDTVWPCPRPVSLKNRSIDLLQTLAPVDRFTRRYPGTPKGTLCYMRPPVDAITGMRQPARARAIVFPQYDPGAEPTLERLTASECFVRLSASSTNATVLGEAAFESLWALSHKPVFAIAYPDLASARMLVDRVWRESADAG